MRTIALGLFLLGLVGMPDPSAADNRAIVAQAATVYIYFNVTNPETGANPQVTGTGFVVTKTGYVLTASHLFREWKAQRDVDKAKNVIRASLSNKPGLVREAPLDLQIVHLGDPDEEDVALLKLPDQLEYSSAPICLSKTAGIGDNFMSYGFPLDGPFQPVPGTFGAANAPGGRFTAASAFTFGMSGGPVYSTDGFVLGLVKGGVDGQDAVRWITPISFGAPLLLTAKYQDTCDPPTPKWSLDNCRKDSEAAQREFQNDSSQTFRASALIDCKNPIGYELLGASQFYKGDYRSAEGNFQNAVRYLAIQEPVSSVWGADLADAYIETGKSDQAVDVYRKLLDRETLNGGNVDYARLGLARAFLYQGQSHPEMYAKAAELAGGVDPSFRGLGEPGSAEIILAAAQAGTLYAVKMETTRKRSLTQDAKSSLCSGIRRSESHWRAVLSGTKPLVHASFREEIRLVAKIGGSTVRCN